MYNCKKVGHKYYKFNRNLRELLDYLKNKYKPIITNIKSNKKKNKYYSTLYNIYMVLNNYYDIKWYKDTLLNDFNINGKSGNIIKTLLYLNTINSTISKHNIKKVYNNLYTYYKKINKESIIKKKYNNSNLVKLRVIVLNLVEKYYTKKHNKLKKTNGKYKYFYCIILNFMVNIEKQNNIKKIDTNEISFTPLKI